MARHGAGRRRTTILLVLACALALGACSNDPEPVASPTTTSETASPSPTAPRLKPVVGERTHTVLPLGPRPLLGLGTNPEPNKEAIQAVAKQVGDWLDAHLDKLQRTGEGLWGQVAADGLANGKQRRQATTELASPDAPVRSARYVMTVYQDGDPQYLSVKVEVTHPDESTSDVGLVFVVGDDGSPVLTMFGPDPVAKAAG